MTKEKWLDIAGEERRKLDDSLCDVNVNDPKNYDALRNGFMSYFKAMDEATEIYNIENKE